MRCHGDGGNYRYSRRIFGCKSGDIAGTGGAKPDAGRIVGPCIGSPGNRTAKGYGSGCGSVTINGIG